MNRNLNKSLIVAILLLLILVTPSYALYEKYRGLMGEWHKANICMPCHVNTLMGSKLESFLTCTPCHNPNLNLKDLKQLEKIHGVNICIKCHVGSEYDEKNLGIHVHDPHYKLNCSTCHGNVASKPNARLCTDCHGSNPHAVHGEILDEICVACHGEKIKGYLPPEKKAKVEVKKPAATKVEKKSVFQSISDLILNLLSFIF